MATSIIHNLGFFCAFPLYSQDLARLSFLRTVVTYLLLEIATRLQMPESKVYFNIRPYFIHLLLSAFTEANRWRDDT